MDIPWDPHRAQIIKNIIQITVEQTCIKITRLLTPKTPAELLRQGILTARWWILEEERKSFWQELIEYNNIY